MKKKVLSVIMTLMLIVPVLTALLPLHVHADGAYCPYCGEWKDDSVAICFNCYICEDCAEGGICDDCLACKLCAYELGFHCPECMESCVDESYGNVPHCVSCLKCENCAELTETSDGLYCEDCLKELSDNGANKMCAYCGVNVIYNEETGEDDDCAECGEHCIECYEKFLCPECNECTLCSGEELCEYCEICAYCAVSNGYHCQYCGDCYADAGQCPDGGEHCKNCCEDICENCDTCTWGAEIEYCEICHKCENCFEHCEICGECFEDVGRCENDGDHCRECCSSEGWLCDQCGRCTEALGLSFCEHCGLCEECCKENSEYYGVPNCILDDETKPEDLDTSKHDKDHHIMVYESTGEDEHDGHCIFPGCDYKVTNQPHSFVWRTLEYETTEKTGKREGTCVQCGEKVTETVPKLDPPEYYFVKQPTDIEALPNKKYISLYVNIGQAGTDEPPRWGYLNISALPVADGDKLPETVAELNHQPYLYFYCEDIKTTHYNDYGMSYNKDGVFPCIIPGTSYTGALYENCRFFEYSAKGKKLTWRIAIYDRRGGNIVYSDPFTIDWNAKHNEHTWVWVCGKLSEYEKKKYDYALDHDYSAYAMKFKDGTYHWRVCSVCGAEWMPPQDHHYKNTGVEGDCQGSVHHFECKECGHKLDIIEAGLAHSYSSDYKFNKEKHWRYCTTAGCNVITDSAKHDFEVKSTFKSCDKTITTYQCKSCGYTLMEREPGAGHKYTKDGEFNGWYGDTTYHWRVCTVCGKVDKAEHTYKGGACSVCGIDIPQMGIIGVLCTHGTSLTIELVDDIREDDKAKFKAGEWEATWIDEDTGNTVGVGKTFPLDSGDEGHRYRAEVSIIGGEEYYAYMNGTIQTVYQEVKGYPATCAAEGLMDHSVCLGCGGKFINSKEVSNVIIPKSNVHTYDNSCDTICNVCGFERTAEHKWSEKYSFTEGGHCHECTVCGITSALEPHELTIKYTKHATCEQDGMFTKSCKCGYNEDQAEPASGHSFVHADAVAATCITEGSVEHFICENCGACAKDANGTDKTGIKKLTIPVDPNNHFGGDKIGYNETGHYTICACGEHINKGAHTFDENDRCTVCFYKKGSAVKTGGKTLTKHDIVEPTCIAEGKKAHYTDGDGKIYLSKAGVIVVSAESLVIPKSKVRHVGGEYGHSDTEHWINCACGEKIKTAEHKFDEHDLCTVCGYQKTAASQTGNVTTDAEVTDNTPEPAPRSNITLIIIIVTVVLLLIAAVIVMIMVMKKKKQKEKDQPSS